jgi:hypothetical protein
VNTFRFSTIIFKSVSDICDLLTYGAEPFLKSCQLCSHSGYLWRLEKINCFFSLFHKQNESPSEWYEELIFQIDVDQDNCSWLPIQTWAPEVHVRLITLLFNHRTCTFLISHFLPGVASWLRCVSFWMSKAETLDACVAIAASFVTHPSFC